jgi:hypothetical protein
MDKRRLTSIFRVALRIWTKPACVSVRHRTKKPMPIIVLTLFFLMLSPHAYAQMIGDQRCKDQQFTSGQVDNLLRIIRSISDIVEMVPPDEANYIHNEARIALEQQNRARFNTVAGRRYYAALQFHDDAKVVVQNLTAARSASGRDLARYLVVVLSGFIDFNNATKSYIDADRKRNSPVLTEENRSTMYYDLPFAKSQTVSLLQCVISVL